MIVGSLAFGHGLELPSVMVQGLGENPFKIYNNPHPEQRSQMIKVLGKTNLRSIFGLTLV